MTSSAGGKSSPTFNIENELASSPNVVVGISPYFRDAVHRYIEAYQIEQLRNWMDVARHFGEECGPYGIHMVDFPPDFRRALPTGWKIFYCCNEITMEHCVADITLLTADKPDKRIWDHVKSKAGDAAYIAGRLIDGVFTISGK